MVRTKHNAILEFAEQQGCTLLKTGKGKTTRILFRGHDLGYVNDTVKRRQACYGYKFAFDAPKPNDAAPKGGAASFRQRYGELTGLDWHEGKTSNEGRTFLCIADLDTAKFVLSKDIADLTDETTIYESDRREGFVTSRNFALPKDAAQMADLLWFNMWQRRQWPYQELQMDDTLYWYDTTQHAIVWKSRVNQIERFKFIGKDEVRKRFQDVFDVSDLNDAYFEAAVDQGYCLAYKVDSLVRLNVPKPNDYRFPQKGWLRCDDEHAQGWLKSLIDIAPADGHLADALKKATAQAEHAGFFSPASLKDERERTLQEIVKRRGQPEFRNTLIAAYGGRCAVTGCDAVAALEAAHIMPYSGPQSHYVTNGLLLRADIHTLFDLDLIGIDPKTLAIALSPAIKATGYATLEGEAIALPERETDTPNHEALLNRWKRFRHGVE